MSSRIFIAVADKVHRSCTALVVVASGPEDQVAVDSSGIHLGIRSVPLGVDILDKLDGRNLGVGDNCLKMIIF